VSTDTITITRNDGEAPWPLHAHYQPNPLVTTRTIALGAA
jgi:hypothetical protein